MCLIGSACIFVFFFFFFLYTVAAAHNVHTVGQGSRPLFVVEKAEAAFNLSNWHEHMEADICI